MSYALAPVRALYVLFLGLALAGCSAPVDATDDDGIATDEGELSSADTKVKKAVSAAARDISFISESDHPLVWINSSAIATGPANAAFVHKNFNYVTNKDPMADKPLSSLKSETVGFESWAARFVPVQGEDADNFAYHTQMTKLLDTVRKNLKNPVVIRMGRPSGNGLVGAISVYVIGTLPSGKIGGVFTVSVET
jgi:hypothetical protein